MILYVKIQHTYTIILQSYVYILTTWLFTLRLQWKKYFTYLLTYLLTYSVEQSSSRKANTSSASQEIPRILWNSKVHYRIHMGPLSVLVLSHINPVHTPTPIPGSFSILSSHLRLGLPSGFFSSDFSSKTLYPPLLSSIRAICPAHLILYDFITQIMFGK